MIWQIGNGSTHRTPCIALQALAEKNSAIAESERCQLKLSLANRLITALASEGQRWAETVQQLRKDYQVYSQTTRLHGIVFIHHGHETAGFLMAGYDLSSAMQKLSCKLSKRVALMTFFFSKQKLHSNMQLKIRSQGHGLLFCNLSAAMTGCLGLRFSPASHQKRPGRFQKG